MAVNRFEIGKLYRISGNDLYNNINTDEIIYCKTLKVVYKVGFIAEFKNYDYLNFYISVSSAIFVQNSDETVYMQDAFSEEIDYVEFVACSKTEDASQTDVHEFAELVSSQYAQVSIYNEYSGAWVDLPCASEYSGIATTLVDSGRNVDGVVIGDVIASDIAKVELKWNFLTIEQYKLVAQLFEPKYNGSFFNAVRFFDVIKGDFDGDNSVPPNTTTNRCRVMYCGDRKVAFAKMKLDDFGRPIGYQNVSLNLIDTHKIYEEE